MRNATCDIIIKKLDFILKALGSYGGFTFGCGMICSMAALKAKVMRVRLMQVDQLEGRVGKRESS